MTCPMISYCHIKKQLNEITLNNNSIRSISIVKLLLMLAQMLLGWWKGVMLAKIIKWKLKKRKFHSLQIQFRNRKVLTCPIHFRPLQIPQVLSPCTLRLKYKITLTQLPTPPLISIQLLRLTENFHLIIDHAYRINFLYTFILSLSIIYSLYIYVIYVF